MSSSAGPGTSSSDHGFSSQLDWRDGFVIALVIPVGLFASIGPSIAALGSWALAALLAVVCVVALLQNRIYSEMATMFPDKSGGIAIYAHEAWRRYFAPAGALAAFGYWAAWAFANAVFAITVGQLVQAQFFSGATWTISTGTADIGLAHLIGVATLISVWVINAMGVRIAVATNKVLGVLAVGLIALLVIGPVLTGDLNFGNLTWGLGAEGQAWGGWRLALVMLFILGWTGYGTEISATFAPEYKDPQRDTPKALRLAGIFTLVVAVLLPLGLGGTVGDAAIAKDPGSIYATAFADVIGPASGLITILLCASVYLVMNSCTADAGRALYGIAKADMTIKQLGVLNSRQVPARAMFCDLVINTIMVLFVGNVLAIIFTGNIGYFLGVCFALSGFALLRRDRPNWPRAIRLSAFWVPVALALTAYNLLLLAVGFLNPADAGYGGTTEQVIGVAILVLSLVLFVYRRVVQDRGPLRLREPAGDAVPPEADAVEVPAGMVSPTA
ncbi:MAG: hypothetical protein QOH46_847 [Solirubrobacteraceae bacterium]|nr:hypothetical protein [Solirubrobacteraceae bacterium]